MRDFLLSKGPIICKAVLLVSLEAVNFLADSLSTTLTGLSNLPKAGERC